MAVKSSGFVNVFAQTLTISRRPSGDCCSHQIVVALILEKSTWFYQLGQMSRNRLISPFVPCQIAIFTLIVIGIFVCLPTANASESELDPVKNDTLASSVSRNKRQYEYGDYYGSYYGWLVSFNIAMF